MARKGPITKDTSSLALGLAQVRVGGSAANVTSYNPVLTSSDSIGKLAQTKLVGETEFFRSESGFPLIEDFVTPIREMARMEVTFNELSPYNVALAYGIDPTGGGYADAHSGEVQLGSKTAPDYVRMEAEYTFPDGTNKMTVIFPRAQVTANLEIDLQSEDEVAVPIVFESKNASSDVSGGSSIWDSAALGRISWTDA